MKSTHKVEVIRIGSIEPCPNADNLEIIRPFGNYQCVVKKGDFRTGDLAAYFVPDTVIPKGHPAFNFLFEGTDKTEFRIKVRRLRKQWSQGLLVPITELQAPDVIEWEDMAPGANLSEILGTRRYEPPEPPQSSLTAKSATVRKPRGFPIPTYDIEPLHRYSEFLTVGEDVVVTEKIHGSQARYTYRYGCFHAGSKGVWRRTDTLPRWLQWLRQVWPSKRGVQDTGRWWALPPRAGTDAWTKTLYDNAQLQDFLIAHPGWVVLGEVYGDGIQDMKYGCKQGEIRFAAFQILTEIGWLPQTMSLGLLTTWKVPTVPILYAGPFDVETVMPLADGLSLMPGAGHIREGVVVCPERQRNDPRLGGPVHLKVVSNAYLERQ
jgi:hypothetical protein